MAKEGLRYGPLGEHAVHVCVDMQNLFATGSVWEIPWLDKVLPMVSALAEAHSAQTVFTRFIPAVSSQSAEGMWAKYYERWNQITLENLQPGMIELVEACARLVPPAVVVDKKVYSPWTEGLLQDCLEGRQADTLVISGGETDVCVLGTVLGAVDRGYRVILASDALCGSADETHDALMKLYDERFSIQIETATVEDILKNWSQRKA